MSKPLIPLEEHNAQAREVYWHRNLPKPNGIACPKCGEELLDSNPDVILPTAPSQLNVHCVCGYKGYRVE